MQGKHEVYAVGEILRLCAFAYIATDTVGLKMTCGFALVLKPSLVASLIGMPQAMMVVSPGTASGSLGTTAEYSEPVMTMNPTV